MTSSRLAVLTAVLLLSSLASLLPCSAAQDLHQVWWTLPRPKANMQTMSPNDLTVFVWRGKQVHDLYKFDSYTNWANCLFKSATGAPLQPVLNATEDGYYPVAYPGKANIAYFASSVGAVNGQGGECQTQGMKFAIKGVASTGSASM